LRGREAAGDQPRASKRRKYKSEAIAILSDESSEEEEELEDIWEEIVIPNT
jgi:hypothetical protein